MQLKMCVHYICILFCFVQLCQTEGQNAQRFLQHFSNGNNNDHLQQLLKGGGAAEINWPQPVKQEVIDVKSELAKLNTTYIYQKSWPVDDIKLGAVSAVSFDKAGNVVVFHRVDRIWGPQTFDNLNRYTEKKRGPISENTLIGFDRASGKVVYKWGKNLFYMPHGLTIDPDDNVWVTDVAMHQVFKFAPRGAGNRPLLTLGVAFQPGSSRKTFCKPTSVAVLNNGDFFVADGYCNARIMKYSSSGELILSWGQNSFAGVSYDVAPPNYFAIPHALTLIPELELLCTADRENGRVQCFYSSNGTFHSQYHSSIIGDRLFSMAYTPAEGGELVIVNGPTAELGLHPDHYNEVHGFVMNMRTKQLVSKFGPSNLQFENPHDVAVTADGNEIYVAELNPTRIHKFLHKSLTKVVSLSAARTNSDDKTDKSSNVSDEVPHKQPSGTAILVASLMLLFAFSTFMLALIMARRRRRGCLPFGTHNRRHAWEKSESFKLGGLLDRGGFEKLDQNASDEEHETTTLSSAQFA